MVTKFHPNPPGGSLVKEARIFVAIVIKKKLDARGYICYIIQLPSSVYMYTVFKILFTYDRTI